MSGPPAKKFKNVKAKRRLTLGSSKTMSPPAPSPLPSFQNSFQNANEVRDILKELGVSHLESELHELNPLDVTDGLDEMVS